MRWMKKAAAAVMAMFVFLPVYAESSLSPKDAYETARKDYLCAWMSMAAYNDPISQLGRNMLVNEHWKLGKASWRLSEEPFMKQFSNLDNLKISASYRCV